MPKTPPTTPAGPAEGAGSPEPSHAGSHATGARGAAAGPARSHPSASAHAAEDAGSAPASEASAAGAPHPGHVGIGPRKRRFLVASRVPPAGAMSLMGTAFAPLQLSAVEQALRDSPDIEVLDRVGSRQPVSMLAAGLGAAGGGGLNQGVLVTRMTDQKAGLLQQQGQGRLLVEPDQPLMLCEPAFRPTLVTGVLPSAGPNVTLEIGVLGPDGTPVPEAEVTVFGSLLPTTATTDAQGRAVLSISGDTVETLNGLYIKPKGDYWSFYQRDPDLAEGQPNQVMLRPLGNWPGMEGFPQQKRLGWGQRAMRLDQLPPQLRGQGIRVAIVDSGIATSHDCLNRTRAGFDIINKSTHPHTWNQDSLGHGSHCAGVVAAAELAFGIRGFAPDAEIHACKLFPGGQVSQLIDALEYCIEQQIDVVNLSLGGSDMSEALEQQIQRAKQAGVACIAAAGNSGGAVQFPAASPNVLAVAALGKADEFPADSYHAQTVPQQIDANGYFVPTFSCSGPQVDVCAPGVAITSTVPPNNYAAWDGTSMAAPHITGLATLVLAHHPEFQTLYRNRGPERVERLFQILRMSARPVASLDRTKIGFGLPDVLVAVGLQPPAYLQGVPYAGMGAGAALGGAPMYAGELPADAGAWLNAVAAQRQLPQGLVAQSFGPMAFWR
jgi:subtilisin family serine protease